jgi:zona occludens toxin
MARRSRQRGFVYLTTGTNGTGKTLLTLKDVREKSLKESRPVYYWNIILAGPALEFGWIEADPKRWQTFPPGAIILVDEAHKYFPKRSGSQNVPAHVEAIAEHRKDGFDFFLITQHPADLDVFIRRRIGSPGWHRHLKRKGAADLVSILEFNSCKDEPEKPSARDTALVTTVGYPKEVYSWYQSAILHTAKFKIPRLVWFIVAGVVGIVALLAYAGYSFTKGTGGAKPAAVAASAPVAAVGVPPGARPVDQVKPVITAHEYAASFAPRVEGLLHTAPAYDGLTAPVKVPTPAACLDWSKRGCKCFTAEGTPYATTADICQQIARHGIYLPFEQRAKPELVAVGEPGRARSADVAPAVYAPGATAKPVEVASPRPASAASSGAEGAMLQGMRGARR